MQTSAIEKKSKISANEDSTLGSAITHAMQLAGVLKETDLSEYIPHADASLSKEIYLRMKNTNEKGLEELIRKYILEQKPKKYPPPTLPATVSKDKITSRLESAIDQAMKKINTKKEIDLCYYIQYQGKRLHHLTFKLLKRTNPEEVFQLIKDNILTTTPVRLIRKNQLKALKKKIPSENERETSEKADDSLLEVIEQAMKRRKLNIEKESDLCWFLPGEGEGCLHYSTFRSLKKKNPEKLQELIQAYILSPKRPWRLTSKPRTQNISEPPQKMIPENLSEKESKIDNLLEKTSQSMEMMGQILQSLQKHSSLDGEKPPVATNLNIDRALRIIQNQLIKQIRQKQADYDLWDAYVGLVDQVNKG